MRVSFVTAEPIDGRQRKIAWFAWQGKGLYYDAGGLFLGSHTSYHVDGNVFRTSPATGGTPRFPGRQLPLSDFVGCHQLGIVMVDKRQIAINPPLRPRDRRHGSIIREVRLSELQTQTPNFVLELVHADHRALLARPEIQPPSGALELSAVIGPICIHVTVLGEEDHLLLRPTVDGFRVRHLNDRFTANRKSVTYRFEAYA